MLNKSRNAAELNMHQKPPFIVITMVPRKKVKCVHEGQYVAEVEVALMEDETGWSPYISVDDAFSLDDVREALRHGDLESAAKYGRIYELHPVTPLSIA